MYNMGPQQDNGAVLLICTTVCMMPKRKSCQASVLISARYSRAIVTTVQFVCMQVYMQNYIYTHTYICEYACMYEYVCIYA